MKAKLAIATILVDVDKQAEFVIGMKNLPGYLSHAFDSVGRELEVPDYRGKEVDLQDWLNDAKEE